MNAGFESEVDGRALRPSSGPGQGDDLGVRFSRLLVVAESHDAGRP